MINLIVTEEGRHVSEYPNFQRDCQEVITCLGCVDSEENVRENTRRNYRGCTVGIFFESVGDSGHLYGSV